MLGSQFLKYFFITTMIIIFSGCSNKSSSNEVAQTPTSTAEKSLQEIVDFVDTQKDVPLPLLETYTLAGVTGVTAENLDEVNTFILNNTPFEVDSIAEIQSFVDTLVDKLVMSEAEKIAVNTISQALANNTTLTLQHFKDANILGVTETNIASIQSTLASLDEGKRDTKLELQALIDIDPPLISILGEVSMQVLQNNTYLDAGATALDTIDGSVAVQKSGEVDTSVVGVYEIYYDAKDTAGNKAERQIRIVRVIDITSVDVQAPQITIEGANPFNLGLGQSYIDKGASAIDNIDKNISVSSTSNININTLGTYSVLYTARDEAGNESNATRVVNVIDLSLVDTEKPIITILGQNPIEVLLNSSYADAGASVSDNVDNSLVATMITNVNTAILGQYAVSYDVTDNSGNKADRKTRVVKVVTSISIDREKPVITLNGLDNLTLSYKAKYTDDGAIVTDNIDATRTIYGDNSVNTSILGTNIVNYNTSDSAGNMADMRVRAVIIVDDIAPVITLLGDEILTVAYGSTYTDQGTSAVDNYDASVTVNIVGSVNTNILGTYTISYKAKDKAGNEAITRVRKVTVADLNAPLLTVQGDSNMTISHGGSYIEQGAIAVDNVDSNSFAVISGNTVDTSTLGRYIIRYNKTDNAGNIATELLRIVDIVDTTKPIIHLNGDSNITLLIGNTYTEANAVLSDNVDVNRTITTSDSVDTNSLGTYILHYNSSDSSGNSALEVLRTVTIGDNQAPSLSILGVNPLTLTQGDTYIEYNATATDNVDTSVTVSLSGTVDDRTIGTYIISYSATDSSGNMGTVTRTVHIVANIAPLADAGLDQNLTEGAYIGLDASASSDSDGNITQYYWHEGGTLLFQGLNPTPTISPLSIGVHILTLTVTDNNHTILNAEHNVSDTLSIRVNIGNSNLKQTGQLIQSALYDDKYYQAGLEHNYSRVDSNTNVLDHTTGLTWKDNNLDVNKTQTEAISICANMGGSWHLPTRKELMTIIDYNEDNPALNPIFISPNNTFYWVNTDDSRDSTSAWVIMVERGASYILRKNSNSDIGVRCVSL